MGDVAKFKRQRVASMTPEDRAINDQALAAYGQAKLEGDDEAEAIEKANAVIRAGLSSRGRVPVHIGDVVLLDARLSQFGGCLMVVDEVSTERLAGYVPLPGKVRLAYHCRPSECRRVGPIPDASSPTTT